MASARAPSPAAPLRRLARARGGIASVEFAIGASFFILALLGLYDFGRASWHRMEVATAAQAGAVYAAANGFNTNGIVAAVTAATSFSTLTASPAPVLQCGCPAGAAGMTVAACGSNCPSADGLTGTAAGYYVTVHARGTYSFMFPYPYVPQPVVMTASAFAKLQ
jgi:Flp pilus assembly protein TadG